MTTITLAARRAEESVDLPAPAVPAVPDRVTAHGCRLCGGARSRTFVDLGVSPPCEAFLPAAALDEPETFYPLHVKICAHCLLVQLPAHLPAEQIFTSDYAYYSSYSSSWVEHARRYAIDQARELSLGPSSLVIEVASNDGYLLQHFVHAGIPALGVEPAGNVAAAAAEKGVRSEVCFLGAATGSDIAARYGRADLVVANNVLAHVPDLRDFVSGLRALLAPNGLLTLEFPHLLRLIQLRQFDTIYHEHYSYFSLLTAQRALALAGLVVVDVEELPTHGGSLRLSVRHGAAGVAPRRAVADLLEVEEAAGLHDVAGHQGFDAAVAEVKHDLLAFLVSARRAGHRVVGYGAPGKGNTLLNAAGIRGDLLPYTVDRNPHKHGTYLPGSRIPVHHPDRLATDRPDFVLVLPWNLRAEIAAQLDYVRDWGGRLVYPVPRLEIA